MDDKMSPLGKKVFDLGSELARAQSKAYLKESKDAAGVPQPMYSKSTEEIVESIILTEDPLAGTTPCYLQIPLPVAKELAYIYRINQDVSKGVRDFSEALTKLTSEVREMRETIHGTMQQMPQKK